MLWKSFFKTGSHLARETSLLTADGVKSNHLATSAPLNPILSIATMLMTARALATALRRLGLFISPIVSSTYPETTGDRILIPLNPERFRRGLDSDGYIEQVPVNTAPLRIKRTCTDFETRPRNAGVFD